MTSSGAGPTGPDGSGSRSAGGPTSAGPGRVWRNVVTEEKLKVAETLAEYRGQYAYNLLDPAYKAFTAEVPQINQWDDHEVTNNGPQAVFVNAPPVANTSPAQGFQHFGEVEIDGKSGAFTVNLRDREGRALWSTTLEAPRRG
jgi:phosphodiesterase/alkaline phosphatase D-like protein